MPDFSNYTDNPPDAFATDFNRALREKGFTGNLPNDFAMNFIRALVMNGFTVVPTGQGPNKGVKLTLHITWNGVYIGQMLEKRWGAKDPCACLYRFKVDGKRTFVNHAPKDFDVEVFALEHGCDLNQLRINIEKDQTDPKKTKTYLWVKDVETSLRLMQDSARRIDQVSPPRGSREPECIQNDLLTIVSDPKKSETQRLDEVAIRLGQGTFRTALVKEFENACAATRLAVLSVLRASHIVPWRDANDAERRNPMNGLLLSANIDALFDRYMITFRPSGKLEVSKLITQTALERLGPIQDLQRTPCDERAAYLRLQQCGVRAA